LSRLNSDWVAAEEYKIMSSADCTDTIKPRVNRSPALYPLALAWFAARQLGWWLARGADQALAGAERARQRRQLAELDDYMLRDIGLTRADVASEISKSFWQQ
jgi:uncharacterized protein YjiS (DUF1127 family)